MAELTDETPAKLERGPRVRDIVMLRKPAQVGHVEHLEQAE
jgi:hypothetical protein